MVSLSLFLTSALLLGFPSTRSLPCTDGCTQAGCPSVLMGNRWLPRRRPRRNAALCQNNLHKVCVPKSVESGGLVGARGSLREGRPSRTRHTARPHRLVYHRLNHVRVQVAHRAINSEAQEREERQARV
eukprot:3933938-Rhodomonas_salina.3